jgi:hypothetical protein
MAVNSIPGDFQLTRSLFQHPASALRRSLTGQNGSRVMGPLIREYRRRPGIFSGKAYFGQL